MKSCKKYFWSVKHILAKTDVCNINWSNKKCLSALVALNLVKITFCITFLRETDIDPTNAQDSPPAWPQEAYRPCPLPRIDLNIVQFLSKHGLVAIHFDRLEKLTPVVKVSSKSVKNWSRFWCFCAVFVKTWACYHSFWSSRKKLTLSCKSFKHIR